MSDSYFFCWNCGKSVDGTYGALGLPFCDRYCSDNYLVWLYRRRR